MAGVVAVVAVGVSAGGRGVGVPGEPVGGISVNVGMIGVGVKITIGRVGGT
jgi:hypothetical protein